MRPAPGSPDGFQSRTYPDGSRDEEWGVRKRKAAAAIGYGIFVPAPNIRDDIAPENVVAMFETALTRGNYPITASEA